ncbi:type I 3-dehydroquinate dehydratase [Lapidilactobacillus bayanensis]|uniref:type I 3-dehydroquinate dehydratase n=1 Tax=Lapidilactobacillus bayanensis TaxID=2485998 RepID=UPI000F767B2E|nr:type I 3-dehydroquinate dehydratase [Lapidilactobacillus bayanensis]
MKIISRNDSWLGVSVTAANPAELSSQLGLINDLQLQHQLLVEWRLDYWQNFSPLSLQNGNRLLRQQLPQAPLLITLRTAEEGGRSVLNRVTYTQQLVTISQNLDWDLLDIMPAQVADWTALKNELQKSAAQQLIYSCHRLCTRTYWQNWCDLQWLSRLAANDEIIKLAVHAQTPQNSLDLLNATLKMRYQSPRPLITMAMGSAGQITRQLGPIFGSTLSFGALTAQGSAPGQLPLIQLDQSLI